MSQQAQEIEQIYHDDTLVELSRFVRDVHAALPGSNLTWADRLQLHRDLGILMGEARGSRRPEVLGVLIRCVCEVLHRGDLTIAATAWIRDLGDVVGGVVGAPASAKIRLVDRSSLGSIPPTGGSCARFIGPVAVNRAFRGQVSRT